MKADLKSWASKIATAVTDQRVHGIAGFVKPAAMVAASSGRMDLISKWLEYLPADQIERDPQLLYWSGTTLLLKRPLEAQLLFERALERFSANNKLTWMLLAWAGVVDSLFFQYRDLHELDSWIAWMTPDREAAVDKLPQTLRCLVVSSMLFALVFRQPGHPKLGTWRERAEKLIEIDSISDLRARLVSGLVLNYTFRGNLAAAEIVQTRFHAQASRKTLSPMALVLSHLNDATLYLHQGRLDECLQAVDSGLSASAKFEIRLWDSILHCHAISAFNSKNEHLKAQQHIGAFEELFAAGVAVDEAYFRSIMFWSVFASGDRVGAVSRAELSLEFTDSKGAPYFQAVCRIGSALVLFESGQRERGKQILQEGISIGQRINNPFLDWIGGLFHAHMTYAEGRNAEGDKLLEKAMQLGSGHSFAHFFYWPGQLIAKLIDKALIHNYSTDYARQLISVHKMTLGETPARSDAWAFTVRIYTFGNPRIEYADGRIEPLSVQFQRQIELLTALISRSGKSVPLHMVASDVYQDDNVDSIGSTKRVLHSLRQRLGHIIDQHHATLSFNFTKVWIDVCSLQQVFREADNDNEIAVWLDQYYRGHFMDSLENPRTVIGLRRKISKQVETCLRHFRDQLSEEENPDALRRFDSRWQHLYPALGHDRVR